jgi:hypothetical protein
MTPALPVVPVGSGAAALDTLVWRLARELAEERRKRQPHPERPAAPAAAEDPPGEAAEPSAWRDLSLAAVWRECHAALAAVAREDRLPLLSAVAYANAALTDLKGALLLLAETPPGAPERNREEPEGDEPPDPVAVLLAESAPGLPPPDTSPAGPGPPPATLEELLETLDEVRRRARWTHPPAAPVSIPREEATPEEMRRWVQVKLAAAPGGAISSAPWFAELRSSPPRFAVLFLTLLEMAQSQTVRLEQRHPEADLLVAPVGF